MNCTMSRSNYRHLVVGSDIKIPLHNGQLTTAINFDNAASTPPFVSVVEEIVNFSTMYSSIHRGTGYKSQYSSQLFEEARSIVMEFVKADPLQDTVIFVKNTTEAINKLSYRLWEGNQQSVILSTCMEHHSNDLPWRNKFQVDYVQTDPYGKLSLEDLESKLIKHKGNVRLVTVTGASNVTGYVNPIHKIAELAHRYRAKMRLQSIPGLTLYSQTTLGEPRIGVIPFNIKGIAHERVATILSNEAGIAVRSGCFCTQPYIQKLLGISSKQMEFYRRSVNAPRPGIVRISFGLYNDFAEIDMLIQLLERIIMHPTTYIK